MLDVNYLFRSGLPLPAERSGAKNQFFPVASRPMIVEGADSNFAGIASAQWDLRFDNKNARAAGNFNTGVNAVTTLANVTGSGYLLYWYSFADGSFCGIPRITVDGTLTTMATAASSSQYAVYGAAALSLANAPVILRPSEIVVGNAMTDREKAIIKGLCAYGVRFETSLLVQTVSSDSNSFNKKHACCYVFDSELEA